MFIDDIAAQDDDIRLFIADAPDQLTKRAGIRRRRIMQVAEPGDAQTLICLLYTSGWMKRSWMKVMSSKPRISST